MSTKGGKLVPVPKEAPIILACVHNEPTEKPTPRLLSEGLLDFSLGHVVTDVDQLDEEDVGHACGDDHRVPHTGEGQSRAVIRIHSRTVEESSEDTSISDTMMIHSPHTNATYPAVPCPGWSHQLALRTPVFLAPTRRRALGVFLQSSIAETSRQIWTGGAFGLLLPFSVQEFYLSVVWECVIACWMSEVAWILLGSVQG